ncbi:NUDIX domain-containing protein [Lactococcus ileimucosae]|uniref:NUDIX domain-containing protein n=1 Tax=Lactococcus ileimucosae TaxID=2941329 RepID=UPI002042F4F2|nr:NUDIX domain-containing protein [Lactococcus ileimucosae]
MYNDLIHELSFLGNSKKIQKIKELLRNSKNLKGKKNPELQLSASALVFKGEKLYFIEHPYQKELLLPAGHVEEGESPKEAALREFHEETGLVAKNGQLVDVNIIEIPFNAVKNEKAHQHIDLRYTFELTRGPTRRAELPVFLLSKAEAPKEFQKYFNRREKRRT